jgi:aminopeptidase-like protein
MKKHTVAGYQIICTGGPADFTYLESRQRDTLTDRVTLHVLKNCGLPHRVLDYTHRASDERQYCAPGVDLPIGSLMRSKYHEYPEYHTSLDDLNFVRPEHLAASFKLYRQCLEVLERNRTFTATRLCEPRLGKYDLGPPLGGMSHKDRFMNDLLAVLAYADGQHDLVAVADKHEQPVWELFEASDTLVEKGLVR